PVGDLNGLRSTVACGLTVAPAPIPADDLGMAMRLQPGEDRLGLAIWQEVDYTAPLEVDKDRSIAMAPTEGEVVDPQHAWIRMIGQRAPPNGAEQGIGASPHGQPAQDAGTGLAAQREPDDFECLSQSRRAASVGSGDTRQALGEDTPPAIGSFTEEPTDGELNGDGDAMPGKVGEGAEVATVDTEGRLTTKRAGGAGGGGCHDDRDGGSVDT